MGWEENVPAHVVNVFLKYITEDDHNTDRNV